MDDLFTVLHRTRSAKHLCLSEAVFINLYQLSVCREKDHYSVSRFSKTYVSEFIHFISNWNHLHFTIWNLRFLYREVMNVLLLVTINISKKRMLLLSLRSYVNLRSQFLFNSFCGSCISTMFFTKMSISSTYLNWMDDFFNY